MGCGLILRIEIYDEIGLLFKSMELSQQIILASRFLSKDDKTEKLVKR